MTHLEKAATQSALTPDTVDAQFCSEWLKGQIKALFFRLERAEKPCARCKYEWDNAVNLDDLRRDK